MYYCSHINQTVLKDIRPLNLQYKNEKAYKKHVEQLRKKYHISEEYLSSVSVFPEIIKYDLIMLLVNADFKLWQFKSKLYIYGIDLEKVKVEKMHIFSTPEEINYINENWKSKFTKKEYTEYKNKKVEYLKKLGILDITKEKFLNSNLKYKYLPLDSYFKLNAKKGNKRQYASYIPHLSLVVSEPINYDFINVMTKDYYVGYIDENSFYAEGKKLERVILNKDNFKEKVNDAKLINLINHYLEINR